MAERKPTKKEQKIHVEFVKQLVRLSTSGFGLVAALAWNNVIQELVNNYIKRWFPQDSGLISLLLYAVLITALAVLVALQLSKLQERVSEE